jgi:hypothetical protein
LPVPSKTFETCSNPNLWLTSSLALAREMLCANSGLFAY